jgi:hypothetical protein
MRIQSMLRSWRGAAMNNRFGRLEKFGKILVPLVLVILLRGSSYATDVSLAWDANTEPDLAGYLLYYDIDSGAPYAPGIDDYVEQYSVDGGNTWIDGPGIPPILVPADITQVSLKLPSSSDKDYFFSVSAVDFEGNESAYSNEISVIALAAINPPYNRGWAITRGDLQGFKVFYNNEADPGLTPTLGPPEDVPPINLSGLTGVGVPLNLQPSGAVFNQPPWIEVPAPGYSSMNQLSLGLYDNSEWLLAWDGAKGELTTAGEGWLDGAPEYNTDEDPHTVSIVVKHFTGVQAAVPASAGTDVTATGGGGGGGCFISAMGRR